MGAGDQPYIYEASLRNSAVFPQSSFNPKAATHAAYQSLSETARPKSTPNGPLIDHVPDQGRATVTGRRPITYPNSQFNPKAVTQAHYKAIVEEQQVKQKKDGPLINFNQHPDSHEKPTLRPYVKPMPARTKKEVTILRWIQFAHRVMNLVAAIGLEVLGICIKSKPAAISWIVRIAPAWDILIAMYAIYHLVRPAKRRTPASSASYHLFALFMDLGLLPFYVFAAIFARANWLEPAHGKGRWTSFFDSEITTTLLFVTFIASASIAGLHLFCAIVDIWLVVLFKRIDNLPPDMNPLEENLTSRKPLYNKHKYKNSDATLTAFASDKHPNYLSGSTLSVDRQSRLSTGNNESYEEKLMPFGHSRTDSSNVYSPHNPDTAHLSRQTLVEESPYEEISASRASLLEPRGTPSPPPKSSARPTSYSVERTGTGLSSPVRWSSPALPNAAPTDALVKSQQKTSLLNDNWYSLEDDVSDQGSPSRHQTPAPHFGPKSNVKPLWHDSFEPQPLRMNPPTPEPENNNTEQNLAIIQRSALTDRRDFGNGEINRHLTVQSSASKDTDASSIYSESSLKNATRPKSRYYGDLAAATRGVRNIKSNDTFSTFKSNGTVDAAAMDSTGLSALSNYGYNSPTKLSFDDGRRSPTKDKKGRVVSRTGVDIADAKAMFDSAASQMRGRRDVSGKVAEEGRGGGWQSWRRW